MGKESIKLVANNKKAYFDYFIDEKYEAGIELFGTEVKSIRMGKCSVKESFVKVDRGEMYICGMHVSPYEKGNIFNKDPLRVRKLLLHKYEILKIGGKIKEKGYTVVPLRVYFKGSLVKGWRVVRRTMTSGRILPRRIREGNWKKTLRSRTCIRENGRFHVRLI